MIRQSVLFQKCTLPILCGLVLLFAPGIACAEDLKIVAVVNEEVITQSDLDRALAPLILQMQARLGPEELAAKSAEMRKKVLDQLIEEKIMLQEAKNPRPVEISKGKIGTPPVIEVSDSEVDQMISGIASKFETPEAFSEVLGQQGLTVEDLKTRYRDQIIVQKLVDREIRSRIVISPTEVTSYYEVHAQEFETAAAVQAAVIVVKPKDAFDVDRANDLANDLRRQLDKGADFYDLASRYSDGPNAKMGGRLGFIEQGQSLKEIDGALFSLKAGQISPVVKTATGFHIFKVESIRSSHRMSLEEAKDEILDRLRQEKGIGLYKEWIAKLKQNAYITIR